MLARKALLRTIFRILKKRGAFHASVTCYKNIVRSPLKTLLTFVLLAAAAFMLVYSASDFALTQREYKRAVETYRGFVSIEKGAAKDSAWAWRPYFLLSDPSNPSNYDNFYEYDTFHQNSISSADMETIINLPYITSGRPQIHDSRNIR